MNNLPGESIEALEKLIGFLPFLIPVVLLQWSLMIFAIVKLLKAEMPPKYLPRWAWVLVIVFINLIGPVLYLMIGRTEE